MKNVGLWEDDFEMSFENDIVVLRRVYDTFSNLLINDGFMYVKFWDKYFNIVYEYMEVNTMASNNANIGFEKQIWDAACVLWGHIPAAEYRKVIVGLIFLRYI